MSNDMLKERLLECFRKFGMEYGKKDFKRAGKRKKEKIVSYLACKEDFYTRIVNIFKANSPCINQTKGVK